ncbi:HD domain-containing protein [Adhaeribacter radiodurans]|uniref:ATP-binding protein n=1 Tax=Adhaeribacter radiodurans TaxID=2745197 RepID=A0A7L7LC37_9BACT|nr:ATP-binding protein [Adhaeribacter radiodurans]QMU30410.1 ATP-binding protein [Adhaeribacter radiodurans]
MSLSRIENTIIWKKTLASQKKDTFSTKREELRSSFFKLRENVSFLVVRITGELPGLTQHDISHLDALWETASLIAGEDFPISPLEGFVLGGAILLHDSALCFEAYENGQIGIRETLQWKDAFSSLEDLKISEEEKKNIADFYALRQLHAIQAETLLGKSWIDPDTEQEIYLLENQNLRKHLGKLIGQIAASHHWDVEMVASKLPSQLNALANFPTEWRIDPVKLACLLRCADASHINNERAPDFLHALLKRKGVSFLHWQAQNRLAAVDIDQSDPNKNTLLFTSTIDFNEAEAESESWFVVYDALYLLNKELQSCNTLLDTRNGISFKVKKVKGVESPESLANFVKAVGWKPCSAHVHVSNIEKLVQNLGGEMLYGTHSDLFGVAIRELIQNARDSIKARLLSEMDFVGKILVKIKNIDDSLWLFIEDNGIGMSERVLTGPLLDFGTSFWTSSLVQSEFPGLRSSNFKSVGKFGIGFYSVFMVAQKVFIATRRWDEGISDIKELKFSSGFTLRPIITKGPVEGFSSLISTQVKLQLNDNYLREDLSMLITTNRSGAKNFYVPFKNYLAALCAGLDVPVFYKENESLEVNIHESIESENFDKEKWLNDISFSGYIPNISIKEYISVNVNRLKPIIENEKILGLAAINTQTEKEQNFLSITTIGGLASTVHARDSENFIGFIDYKPKSAKRDQGDYSASPTIIKDWAQNQLAELLKLNLSPHEKTSASAALCSFGVDPISIAHVYVLLNGTQSFVSIDTLADLSVNIGIAFLESSFGSYMETHHNFQYLDGFALVVPLAGGPFLKLELENGIPLNNNSIIDCLHRSISKKGYLPNWEKSENVDTNRFNEKMNALVVSSKMATT